MNYAIDDNQVIFRSVHHPFAFKSSGKIFNYKKSWNLKRESNRFLTSVVWRRFAPSLQMAHAYGCRTSRGRRSNNIQDVYCGFYAIQVGELRASRASEGVEGFDVEHIIEVGEIAHSNVVIVMQSGLDDDDMEAAKTYALDRLDWLKCGPEVHCCECDLDIEEHPSVMLPLGKKGVYSDGRSAIQIVVDFIFYRAGTLEMMQNGLTPAS
jgi:hypothetical protein